MQTPSVGSIGGKNLTVSGPGNVAFTGNILTNGFVTLTVSQNGNGTLLLTGSNHITRLNLQGAPGCALDIGAGYLFLDNLGSTTLYATQDAVISGTGKIRLGTSTARNYADCYSAPGRTVVVHPSLVSDGGFELWSGSGTWVFKGINLFASNILFGASGTISVDKIGNQGSTDSNLGMGQRIIMQSGGCKLLYTGAGETTDRIIELASSATLDHSGTGTLTFSTPMDVLGNTKTLTLQGSTAGIGEIAAPIGPGSATTSLAKEGAGAWRLTATNALAGTTTVRGGTLALTGADGTLALSTGYTLSTGGTLALQNTAVANNTNRLRDASAITLTGGTLAFSHTAGSADYEENVGAVTASQNGSTIAASRAAPGRTSVLRAASLARTAGATVNFVGEGLGLADGRNAIIITGQAAGLIGSWATVNGTNLAAYSTTLGVYASAEPAYNQEISALGPSTINDAPADFVRISSQGTSGDIDLQLATTRIAGLKQDTAYGTVIKTAGKTLQTAGLSIPDGKASVTVGASAGDGTLSPLTSGGDVALINDSASALTVNAVLANNTSASSLTKMGGGSATLTAGNTFSGATTVGAGSLVLAHSDALQSSTVSSAGTVFDSSVAGPAFTFGGLSGFYDLSLLNNAGTPSPVALTVGKNNGSATFSGSLTGPGSLTKIGTGTLTLSGTNTFSGGLTISAGQVTASAVGALGTAPVVNNGVLNLTGASDITYTGLSAGLSGAGTNNVTLGSGAATVFLHGDYSGFTGLWNIGTGAAAGAAKVFMNGADNPAATVNVLSNGTFFCNAGNHAATLYLRGGNTGESYGQLRIENNASWSGPVYLFGETTDARDGFLGSQSGIGYISGIISDLDGQPHAVNKLGTGTLALLAENTYQGQTWVREGVLRVSSMKNVGAASSALGAPANAANGTVRIGSNTVTATLQYVGMGDTSDRVIDMAGVGGGAYLDHSGTNLWRLTGGVIASMPNNKQLRLQGSTLGTGEIASAISDYSPAFSVNLYKTGSGAWILSGDNTFKGNVLLDNGPLIIRHSNAFGTGPKTVESVNSANGANPNIRLDGSAGDLTIPAPITFRTSNSRFGAIFNEAGNNTILGTINLVGGDGDTVLNAVTGKLTVAGNVVAAELNRQLRLWGNGDGEISGIISNGTTASLPVLKENGKGTWVLSGANAHSGITYANNGTLVLSGPNGALAGNVAANGGTLIVSNTPAANNPNRLGNSATVTLNSGSLLYASEAGAADYSETAGTLTVASGTNRIVTSRADADHTSTLTFASLTRTGGSVDFAGAGLGEDVRNRIVFTAQPALASGLIGPWATYNGGGFASYDTVGTLGVIAAPDSAYTNIAARGPYIIPDNAAFNARIATAGTEGNVDLEGASVSSANTLLQSTVTDSTIDTSNKLFRTSGIGIAAGQASLTIGATEASGQVSALAAGGDLALFNHDAAATLTVNAGITNNTSSSTLTKYGAGKVVLNGSNTYSGATSVNEGTLEFGGTIGRRVTNVISGPGTLVKNGASLLHVLGNNTFTGPFYINEGLVRADLNTTFGTATGGVYIASGATLDLGCDSTVGGTRGGDALNMGTELFVVSGAGVDGAGAIVCNGGQNQANAINRVSLTGNTTIGGNRRWDLRSNTPFLHLNDYTLTKTGINEIAIINTPIYPGAGHVVLNQGLFRLESGSVVYGTSNNTVTVNSGASLELYNLVSSIPAWKMIINEGGLFRGAGTSVNTNMNIWGGPVTLNGLSYFFGSSGNINWSVAGDISGSGPLVKVGQTTSTLYLTGTNNTYTGSTIVQTGTLYAVSWGSLPGYKDGKVSVSNNATLAVVHSDGVKGWTEEQIDDLRTNLVYIANTAALGIDTSLADLVYDSNISQPLSLTKYGNRTLTLTGVNTYSGTTRVYGGTNSVMVLANTSSNTLGPIIVSGGNAGAVLKVEGYTSIGTNDSQVVTLGPAATDRSTLVLSTNFVAGKIFVGNALYANGAVIQNGNTVSVAPTRISTDTLSVGINNGYGYYRLAGGGTLNVGQFGVTGGGGTLNHGVIDILSGTLNVTGNGGWLIWGWGGGNGILNLFDGTVTAPVGNNDTTFAYNVGRNSFAMLNLLGPNAVLNATGNSNQRGIDMARSSGNLIGVVNLNAGTILANRVRAGVTTTPSYFHFNGGTLKANPGTGFATNFMQGLSAAIVYPGGAVIDTTNNAITLNQPLLAPAGYGAASIPLRSGGLGYIGAPVVMISGGSGTGATAIATVDLQEGSPTHGRVTGITVTSPGSGYQAGDALTVALIGGGYTNNAPALAYNALLAPNAASGGLTKQGNGTLTLGGTNTYGGMTAITQGTLKLGNALALPTGTPVVLAGGTLDLNGFTVTNSVSGSGTVTNGTIATLLSPAGTGALGVDTLAFRSASVEGAYLADVASAGSSDRVDVQGDINLSGIDLQIVDTDLLNRNQEYTLLTCTGARTGAFKSHNLPDSRWRVIYQANGDVKLVFVDGLILILR